MATSATKRPFLSYSCNGGGIDRRQIRVDDARLRMRRSAQSLAKQPFGRISIAQRRQQKVNGGARRIDRSIQVAPATLNLDVSLVDTPRLVGWLQMAPQALVEFRSISLHPAPHRRVVGFQTTFLEQFFHIAQ
jgi:exonuclease V gamma subunit